MERGPIRPPSEARSLLLRVVRGCPWNRCTFCPVYKGSPFSLREPREVLAELKAVRRTVDDLGGQLPPTGVSADPSLRLLLPWLRTGCSSVFLQDADALVAGVEPVLTVLDALRRLFPAVTDVTTYARSHTLARLREADLRRLRLAGLTRIHVGLESACDEVLALHRKGATFERSAEACGRVRAAGIELCVYVMPGLGGRGLAESHVERTVAWLRQVEPATLRLRSLVVLPGTPLEGLVEEGSFVPRSETAVVDEIRLLVEGLDGARVRLESDHSMNLLTELSGDLGRDGPALRGLVGRFLALPEDERRLFILGRRLGWFLRLADLEERSRRERASEAAAAFEAAPDPEAAVRAAVLHVV